MKWCSGCKLDRPLSDFRKNKFTKDGYRYGCKDCQRKYNQKVKKPKTKEARRKDSLKSKYGITPNDYELMLIKQNGTCKICRKECDTGRRLSVDHCHKTGKIRGLLCGKCNRGLGNFRDKPELLEIAANYLRGGP